MIMVDPHHAVHVQRWICSILKPRNASDMQCEMYDVPKHVSWLNNNETLHRLYVLVYVL